MSEFKTEHQRAEAGKLGRDFIDPSPEAVRLRALIDAIGAFVVVETASVVDVVETVSFNDEYLNGLPDIV